MNNNSMQIRLGDLLHAVLKNKVMILTLTVIGFGVGIILSIVSYARGEITREYAVNTSLAVTSVTADGLFTTNSKNPNSNDVYLAENMVDSVIYVLKSDKLLNAAANRMGLIGIATSDISSNLSLKQYNETQIIEITLYWRSAEEGVQILSAINSVAPNILIETLKIGGVSVVNEPTARYRVGGSVNASLWVYTAALGLALGLGFSIIRLLVQPTLTNVRDMTDVFSVEIVGEIPNNRPFFQRKRTILEDIDNLGGNVVEEFAAAAHLLLYRIGDVSQKCMYITSAQANEGKTSVAAHLAVQIADMGKKVLLVDLDVHNPTLGTKFLNKVEYVHSLNALYRGDSDAENAIIHLTANLDILPSILERREIPLSDETTRLIQNLSQNYDLVLMDTAPIGMVSDPLNLNRIAKDAIFVVRFDYSGMSAIRDALDKLDKSGANIIGCIVNNVVSFGRSSRYRYYHNQYNHHYTGSHQQTEDELLASLEEEQ